MTIPPNHTPPPQEAVQLANQELADTTINQRLATQRIKLFQWAIVTGIVIIAGLVMLLGAVVIAYLYQLLNNKTIPADFWHIPLMLVFMISTIFSIMITLSAKFGSLENKESEKTSSSVAEHIPLLTEIKNLVEKLLDKK